MDSALAQRLQPSAIDAFMDQALRDPDCLSLAIGLTDNQQLPADTLRQAWSLLDAHYPNRAYLQYGPTRGAVPLREGVVHLLQTLHQEDSAGVQDLAITNGSQQALYLALQVLCDPGDIVLVQNPTYFVWLDALRAHGVVPWAIPCDAKGAIDAVQLDALLTRLNAQGLGSKLKAVYWVSCFSNPQGHSVSLADKTLVGQLLQQHRLQPVLIEDAAYRELYFHAPCPAPSLHRVPSLQPFARLYTGTFTKPFATGLRVGFVWSSHRPLLDKMMQLKAFHDFGSAHLNQALIETVLRQGWYPHILARARSHYAHKAQLLHDTLTQAGLHALGWRWEPAQGGLFLWLRGPFWLDAGPQGPLSEACLRHKVLYLPGALCYATAPQKSTVRLCFSHLPPQALVLAGQRFVQAVREVLQL
jgi:2-aminoadipate transaminase